ncbi:porin [Geobacter pickeringii]|uniref:Porin n=1 Tax=Geobacter pickeringii TaxID=345632 RepID=A0A0B5BHY5_9BACT|nr:porin [Geobacter pickeringii]AJE04095.1 porin [Geobacter pickeringii]
MKSRLIAVGALAAVLAGQSAFAKTLEDVLKEKGVITEEDYKEVNKSRPVSYKLGQGFTFTSPDEKFQGSIGGSMQLRYTFTDLDDANGSQTDTSEFKLRRIKLFFNGYAYSKDLTYKLQMNLAELNNSNKNNTSKFLEETYVNYRILDEAQLRFGQDKVPFARQELVSTTALQFVDRSFVTDAFKPSYDIGLALHGKVAGGLVGYQAGVYGGAGQNTFRSSNDNSFAARIVANPLGDMAYSESDVDNSAKPLVSVGASYFRDTIKNTAGALETNNLSFANTKSGWLGMGLSTFNPNEKIDTNSYGIDAAFKWHGFSAQGEYFLAQADGQTTNNTLRAHGFYAQAGYFILPGQLEVAARYGYLDPNRDVTQNIQTQTQGAVSYFFAKHNLKVQADVTNIHQQYATKSNTDDMQYRLQAQVIF